MDANDQFINEMRPRLLQASKDKQLWGLLTYLLIPLSPIFVTLWFMAIRRERRMIRQIATHIGVPEGRSNKWTREQVGDYLGSNHISGDSWGPAAVIVVFIAVIAYVGFRLLTA